MGQLLILIMYKLGHCEKHSLRPRDEIHLIFAVTKFFKFKNRI